MSCLEDVAKIAKKLDKMVSTETVDHATSRDLMKTLKRLPISLEILQKTRIGMTVNNFRKSCKDDDVVTIAKGLIKSWKKLLPDSNNSQSSSQSQSLNRTNSTASISSSKDDDNSRDSQQEEASSSRDSPEKSDTPNSAVPSSPTTPVNKEHAALFSSLKASETSDSVRLKCRELLTVALKAPLEGFFGGADPDNLAGVIEDHIYKEFRNTEMKYKNRVRSRIANLKDQKNPDLRKNVLSGDIRPEQIAAMSAEEMASKDMKTLRDKMTKEAINEHQMSQQGGTMTDFFKCGRCGQRKCMYNQVQTRSADEPMTTFVVCMACGNRWKFC